MIVSRNHFAMARARRDGLSAPAAFNMMDDAGRSAMIAAAKADVATNGLGPDFNREMLSSTFPADWVEEILSEAGPVDVIAAAPIIDRLREIQKSPHQMTEQQLDALFPAEIVEEVLR